MAMARLQYLEMPTGDLAASRAFYTAAFAWTFTGYGPDYAATTTGDTDVGLDAGADRVTRPLPVIEVDDLAGVQAAVERAGGTITVPVFAFPGGRRFHFRDPDGHELAVMQAD